MDNIFEMSSEFSAETVCFILESFDNGLRIEEISEIYNLDRRIVSWVISEAKRLKNLFMTQRRRFRLYKSGSKKLSAASPSGTGGLLEATHILQKLAPGSMEELPLGLKQVIFKYLRSTMYLHPYIPVESPQEVLNILHYTKAAVPKSRWLLSIQADDTIEDSVINGYWGGVLEAVGEFRINRKSGGARQNPNGLGYIYFLRHDLTEAMLKNIREKNYGQYSSLLKACHELAIYSGALSQYSNSDFEPPA